MLQALAVKVLTISEDDEIRGMKHEVTMGNICSSNNNNKVVNFEMSRIKITTSNYSSGGLETSQRFDMSSRGE